MKGQPLITYIYRSSPVEYSIYDGQEQVSTKVLHQGDGIYISTGCLHSAKGMEPSAVLAGFVFPITFFDIKPFENLYGQSIRPIIESGFTNMILYADDLVVSFIHAHFNKHISIDDIARSAKISRTECFRCFQAILRKSPMEYVTEYRLSMATVMLASTNRTVSDIASSCGFSTLSYFCKLFREQCWLPPKKYREQAHVRA